MTPNEIVRDTPTADAYSCTTHGSGPLALAGDDDDTELSCEPQNANSPTRRLGYMLNGMVGREGLEPSTNNGLRVGCPLLCGARRGLHGLRSLAALTVFLFQYQSFLIRSVMRPRRGLRRDNIPSGQYWACDVRDDVVSASVR